MDEIKLDVKDKKILLSLDMNARQADSQIAKSVGLSKQLANYRIKRLEKKGIIRSYYSVIDHTRIGLKMYRIGIKLGNADKEKEAEILGHLKKKASWIVSVFGKWDIWMVMYARDEYDFMEFWNNFYGKYSYYIESSWISLITRLWNFERSFVFPSKKNRDKYFVLGSEPACKSLDKTDRQILQELTKNARQNSLEIAKKIKQTERVVRYRIKKLENDKIIMGHRAFLNTELMGLKFYKIFVTLTGARLKEKNQVNIYIFQNPNVVYATEALGGYDFEFEANFSDSQELYEFISKFKEAFPKIVRSVSFMEHIKEHKLTYYPLQ